MTMVASFQTVQTRHDTYVDWYISEIWSPSAVRDADLSRFSGEKKIWTAKFE